jgi:hypothetical protein
MKKGQAMHHGFQRGSDEGIESLANAVRIGNSPV